MSEVCGMCGGSGELVNGVRKVRHVFEGTMPCPACVRVPKKDAAVLEAVHEIELRGLYVDRAQKGFELSTGKGTRQEKVRRWVVGLSRNRVRGYGATLPEALAAFHREEERHKKSAQR